MVYLLGKYYKKKNFCFTIKPMVRVVVHPSEDLFMRFNLRYGHDHTLPAHTLPLSCVKFYVFNILTSKLF